MHNDKQHMTDSEDTLTQFNEMTDEALDDLISTSPEGSLGAWDDA
jgi:hypothetical protein